MAEQAQLVRETVYAHAAMVMLKTENLVNAADTDSSAPVSRLGVMQLASELAQLRHVAPVLPPEQFERLALYEKVLERRFLAKWEGQAEKWRGAPGTGADPSLIEKFNVAEDEKLNAYYSLSKAALWSAYGKLNKPSRNLFVSGGKTGKMAHAKTLYAATGRGIMAPELDDSASGKSWTFKQNPFWGDLSGSMKPLVDMAGPSHDLDNIAAQIRAMAQHHGITLPKNPALTKMNDLSTLPGLVAHEVSNALHFKSTIGSPAIMKPGGELSSGYSYNVLTGWDRKPKQEISPDGDILEGPPARPIPFKIPFVANPDRFTIHTLAPLTGALSPTLANPWSRLAAASLAAGRSLQAAASVMAAWLTARHTPIIGRLAASWLSRRYAGRTQEADAAVMRGYSSTSDKAAWLRALNSSYPEVSALAAERLVRSSRVRFSKAAGDLVPQDLKNVVLDPASRPWARSGALRALTAGPLLDEGMLDGLERFAHDPDAGTRLRTAQLLARNSRLQAARTALRPCLVDRDPAVRVEAILGLHQIPPGRRLDMTRVAMGPLPEDMARDLLAYWDRVDNEVKQDIFYALGPSLEWPGFVTEAMGHALKGRALSDEIRATAIDRLSLVRGLPASVKADLLTELKEQDVTAPEIALLALEHPDGKIAHVAVQYLADHELLRASKPRINEEIAQRFSHPDLRVRLCAVAA
ncbi:MAG: HEAT repeat domain-containing protein, partial [Elusimicrobia bacterium]|nr:HEAT repeat domain-containing protein [Elusimicrobiota bacterium]